jgi:hypothetical protein
MMWIEKFIIFTVCLCTLIISPFFNIAEIKLRTACLGVSFVENYDTILGYYAYASVVYMFCLIGTLNITNL